MDNTNPVPQLNNKYMIVFAAIVPHSPLLTPNVGKEHQQHLQKTIEAYQKIEQALYVAKPETIVVISPHAPRFPDSFSATMAAKFTGNLKSFGDFSTTVSAKGDFMIIDHINRKMRQEKIPFTLTPAEELDYGITIPLLLLTKKLSDWKVVPLACSMMDGNAHYEYGRQMKRILHKENNRVAIIASADLSHKLTAQSPGGASIEGPKFDEWIQKGVIEPDPTSILNMPKELIENSGQCGYRPICTLLGTLDNMHTEPKILSYEAPFGVGYLTVTYEIT